MTLVNIGEFARLSRLSPKALRLYDRLELLRPARVDPDSGYRWYETGQLDQARLVASLRQLGVPLARIRPLLELDAASAAEQISAFWTDAETEHANRRQLAGSLVDRLNGKRSDMYEVTTREVPARHLLCLQRHVDGDTEAWALGKEFVGIFRDRPVPRLAGRAGSAFAIYHGQVNEDSDGPIEWCRPVPDDQADELVARFGELTLRTEPAHREAFVHLGDTLATPPRWELVWEALYSWATEHHQAAADLGVRVTYLARPPAVAPRGPDCDFAVPLR